MTSLIKPRKNLEKEALLQAVIVVDDFDGIFSDFTEQRSSALLPVANFHVIDYAIESLGHCGFHEAIIFCSSHAQAIKDYIRKSPWSQPFSKMSVTILVSEKCQSLGDVLRDIDNKAIIKGDFVLLSSFTVTNLNLLNILTYHKLLCARDRGTAMTMIVQDIGYRIPQSDNSTYVVNAATNRLLMHVKPFKINKFEIPLKHLIENSDINIYSNLIDTGVAICSPSVPLLFSDNFDFQTKEDFIRGLLLNEEILDSRIYCYQVCNGYGATIRNWQTFQKVNLDCIHRWTFPLVPDQLFTSQDPFLYYRNCIYKQPGVQLLNSVALESDVVIGAWCQIGENTKILRSVIGKNCTIGKNVFIRDSYIFDSVVIEDECKIELSVIGENSKIKSNCKITKCFLKKQVFINEKSNLEEVLVTNKPTSKHCKKLSENAYFLKIVSEKLESNDNLSQVSLLGFIDPEVNYPETEDDDDVSSISDGDKSYTQSPEPDDIQLFYSEVVESLHRGFEEKLSCENLILEINSSRYAYNVSLSDVTIFTLKSILLLPKRVGSNTKELLTYFLPLLKNYIKTSQSQMDSLELIEEISDELGNDIAKSLHFLYDNDIITEDNILLWHNNIEKGSSILPKVAPLIKWLKEAAEESSEESV